MTPAKLARDLAEAEQWLRESDVWLRDHNCPLLPGRIIAAELDRLRGEADRLQRAFDRVVDLHSEAAKWAEQNGKECDRLRASLATARDDDKRELAYIAELERQVERLTSIIRDAAVENARIPSSNLRLGEMLAEALASLEGGR